MFNRRGGWAADGRDWWQLAAGLSIRILAFSEISAETAGAGGRAGREKAAEFGSHGGGFGGIWAAQTWQQRQTTTDSNRRRQQCVWAVG